MDPDANWQEAIRLAWRIQEAASKATSGVVLLNQEAARLADLVLALDDWASSGGFPPKVFKRR